MPKIKKIVTICGGNGGFSLLRGLKKFDWEISAVVNMTDNGGSTGRLRTELGVLPPGDIRYCLSALSTLPETWENVWNYRFESGGLKGHTAGNILLAGLEKFYGSFLKAVIEMEQLLHVKGKIVPATLVNATLCAKLKNGKIIKGEHEINIYEKLQEHGVEKLFIEPRARTNPFAVKSIMNADVILIGPGNLYCSILPTLILPKIRKAIRETKALVIFNCNLINRKDQTEGFTVNDYINIINRYLGSKRVDAVTVQKQLESGQLKTLCVNPKDLVKNSYNENNETKPRIFEFNLLDKECTINRSSADAISYLRSPVRHDGRKVGEAAIEIFSNMRK